MRNFFKGLGGYLAVALILVSLIFVGMFNGTKPAEAQTAPVAASDLVLTQSIALSGVPAVIFTGVTSANLSVIALDMESSSAGVVSFQETSGGGGTSLASFYLAATTPRTISSDVLGNGFATTTTGHTIYAVGAGTLTITARVRKR